MRADQPSLTALGVAIARANLDRPSTPHGDVDAERALAESLLADVPDEYRERADSLDGAGSDHGRGFRRVLRHRTAFFDDAVLRAIDAGIGQVVILGAGYDGRAFRFRSPQIQFFEIDHPATQADKLARIDALDIDETHVRFAAADFTEGDLEEVLEQAGHVASEPSLFTVEGVLRYLPEEWFRELLATLARRAAAGSELAVSIVTRPPVEDDAATRRAEHDRLAKSGEPVLTVPERDVAVRWLGEAGWTVDSVVDVTELDPDVKPGRLLVRAHPTGDSH